MVKLYMLQGEKEICKINANYAIHGGHLYLTNMRVVYITYTGKIVYTIMLKEIQSYNVQLGWGFIKTRINITKSGVTDYFEVDKNSGKYFGDMLEKTLSSLNTYDENKNCINNPTSEQEANNSTEGVQIKNNNNNFNNNRVRYSNYIESSNKLITTIIFIIIGIIIFGSQVLNVETKTLCKNCYRCVDCKKYYYYDYDGQEIYGYYCDNCADKLDEFLHCPIFK